MRCLSENNSFKVKELAHNVKVIGRALRNQPYHDAQLQMLWPVGHSRIMK